MATTKKTEEAAPRVSYRSELARVLRSFVEGDDGEPLEDDDARATVELETASPEGDTASDGHLLPGAPKDKAPPAHAPSTKVTKANLMSHPDAHPMVLDLAMLYQYGAEWLGWEPETVRYATAKDLGPMSDLNYHKLMACAALHKRNSFWQRWEVFVWCIMPFNNIPPDFEQKQVPTVADILVGVEVAKHIRDDQLWSDEVRRYIEVVYRHDGLFVALPPADFVSLDATGLPFNPPDVLLAWPHVRKTGAAPTSMTGEADQLRKMLAAHQALTDVRRRLRAQLPLVQYR